MENGYLLTQIASQFENKSWRYVDKPENVRVLDSRWVFTKKKLLDGSTKHKARLVVRGFLDNNKYVFGEIYAPTSGIGEVRSLLALVNYMGWNLEYMDVETAFLTGKLEKPVFMAIPEGIDVSKKFRKEKVCLLERAIYGLRCSPKRWFVRFKEAMEKMGFHTYELQSCLFYWKRKNPKTGKQSAVILLLFVDDTYYSHWE